MFDPHFHPCCHTALASLLCRAFSLKGGMGQCFGSGRECLTKRRGIAVRSEFSVNIRI